MTDRIRWTTDFVGWRCDGCEHVERMLVGEQPIMPDDQKHLVRRAREHARKTGHTITVERSQSASVEA